MTMIEVNNLEIRRRGVVICAIDHLAVEDGQRAVLIGPNGCGKTTLLRVLAGLERNFQGQCSVTATGQDCAYVHQNPLLFRGNVLFNVKYGLRARHVDAASCEKSALTWLDKLGIGHLAQRPANRLSGGEARRVALARAMVLGPRMLLLDEPLAEMDSAGIASVREAIDTLRGSTVVMSSPVPVSEELGTTIALKKP